MIRIKRVNTLEIKGTTEDINHYNKSLFDNSPSDFVDIEKDKVFICTVCRKPVGKSDSMSCRGKSLICCACQARLENILGVSSATILHLVHQLPCTIEINKCEQNMNKKLLTTHIKSSIIINVRTEFLQNTSFT